MSTILLHDDQFQISLRSEIRWTTYDIASILTMTGQQAAAGSKVHSKDALTSSVEG